jgi:uncharacterized protein
LWVDDAIRNEMERLALAKGITASDLLRQAIDGVISHHTTLRGRDCYLGGEEIIRSDLPRSLSPVERKTLALLHEILDRVDSGDPDDHGVRGRRRRIEILRGGFTGEYFDAFAAVEPEISLGECELLWNIMDMFAVLRASITKLESSQGSCLDADAIRMLTFQGLDLHDPREARLLAYARHLISTGRWADLAEYFDDRHAHGSSRVPRLSTYLLLLAAYHPVWKRNLLGRAIGTGGLCLTAEELAELVSGLPPEVRR